MAEKCLDKGCNCTKYEEQTDVKESKGRDWWKPLAIGGVCAVGGAVLAPIAVPAALGAIGFSSGGVVAGSWAAAMMSSVGNVAAGSSIAVMQSIGAAGLGAAGTAASAAGATGFAASAAAGAGKDEDKGESTCDCKKICTNCGHCKCKHVIKVQ